MLDTLLAIALIHWAALLTPGANVLLVSNLAAEGFRRQACFAALGVTFMGGTWAILAAVGVSAIFAAHPYLRAGLQVAGGLYLLNMAYRLAHPQPEVRSGQAPRVNAAGAFRLGVTTNALNPKSSLFFGSIFTTALPANAPVSLVATSVGLVVFNALTWHFILAFAFSHPAVSAAYARQRVLWSKVAAVLVGLFGLRLLLVVVEEFLFPPSSTP